MAKKQAEITAVRVYVVDLSRYEQWRQSHPMKVDQSWTTESVIATPMSRYPAYRATRSSWSILKGDRVLVEIDTNLGVRGVGMTSGKLPVAAVIKHHLTRFLIGMSPFDVEKLWDIMYRATLPYGRKGVAIHAISAVDIALWDCIAKLRDEPLYVSLGGAAKDSIPVYTTGNDVQHTKASGFVGHKLAMPYGPSSGIDGMRKNTELVRQTREALGDDLDIMLDCYMAWDVPYTIRMAELVKPYRVRWIEEPLPPDDYSGYGELNRKITSTAIATGEHEYTRYGFQQLFDAGGAAIIQPDVFWCGGLSEAKKICALASARNIPVIPHAGGVQPWAQHLMFAEPGIPMAEYFYGAGLDDPYFDGLQLPENGCLRLPNTIGMGISIKKEAFEFLQEVE